MTIAGGIVTYVILWWVTFFCVLPIGIRPADEGHLGHDPGAPANPYIGRRVLATTLIAAFLFGIAYLIITSDWISFRPK